MSLKKTLLAIALALATGCTTSLPHAPPSKAAPAAAAKGPKLVYDAAQFLDQPDRRSVGMAPLYVAYAGTLNNATTPEAANEVPYAPQATFAIRRLGRDAAALEPGVPYALQYRPSAYDRVPQPLCLDFEQASLTGPLYSEAVEDGARQDAVSWLRGLVTAAKTEVRGYGRELGVGAYFPLLPPSWVADPAAAAAIERDWRPYLDVLEVAYPEAYIHGPDLEAWKKETRATLDACTRYLPGRPVYPFVCPQYAYRATPELAWTPIPKEVWKEAVEWLLAQPEVAGAVFWGGFDVRNDPSMRTHLPWSSGAAHQKVLTDAAKRAS